MWLKTVVLDYFCVFYHVLNIYHMRLFDSDYGSSNTDPDLVIQIESGSIKGIDLNDHVRAWLGIPYAEPPVGKCISFLYEMVVVFC